MVYVEFELICGRAVSDADGGRGPTSGQRAQPEEARRAVMFNPPGVFLIPAHR